MNKLSLTLLIIVAILFSMGLIMVFNTSSAEVLTSPLSNHFSLFKQACFAALSFFVGCFVYIFGYKNIIKSAPFFYVCFLVFLALVFVPGIGQRINGANRWLGFGMFSFQPSEFMKVLIPLFYLHRFVEKKEVFTLFEFLKIFALLLLPLILILMEPDNGSAAMILATFVVLFFLTKIKWTYWALPLGIIMIIGVAFAFQMPHVHDRIRVYLHPETDILGKGHQPYQAKIAAGSGGLFGRGIGESIQKFNYLPEARSDYIAAIYAEEFGYLGVLMMLILYMGLSCVGFLIAARASSKEGYYLASILTFVISIQAFLNLGVVSGLLPSKGTNLPFFSQGGSSLIANVMMIAILISISKGSLDEKHA